MKSEENQNLRVAIYSRCSTPEQKTIEGQIEVLKEYISRQPNWTLMGVYTDTASGKLPSEQRAGLNNIFKLASQKKIDLILFWALDRFSREGSRKTLEYLTRLDSYGVKWHSYQEPGISTLGIFSDVIVSILAALGKQEAIRISERTKLGLERARKAGKHLGRKGINPELVEQIKLLRQKNYPMKKIKAELGLEISVPRICQILNDTYPKTSN